MSYTYSFLPPNNIYILKNSLSLFKPTSSLACLLVPFPSGSFPMINLAITPSASALFSIYFPHLSVTEWGKSTCLSSFQLSPRVNQSICNTPVDDWIHTYTGFYRTELIFHTPLNHLHFTLWAVSQVITISSYKLLLISCIIFHDITILWFFHFSIWIFFPFLCINNVSINIFAQNHLWLFP